MSLDEELLAIERGLWTNDPELYRASLLPDAMLVFPETGPIGRDFAVEAIRAEVAENRKWAEVRFEDVSARELTSDVSVLVYKAFARWNHEERGSWSLASSVYVRSNGTWKLAHHQQGPVPS